MKEPRSQRLITWWRHKSCVFVCTALLSLKTRKFVFMLHQGTSNLRIKSLAANLKRTTVLFENKWDGEGHRMLLPGRTRVPITTQTTEFYSTKTSSLEGAILGREGSRYLTNGERSQIRHRGHHQISAMRWRWKQDDSLRQQLHPLSMCKR